MRRELSRQQGHFAVVLALLVAPWFLAGCGDSTAEIQRPTPDADLQIAPDGTLDTFIPTRGCCVLLPAGLTSYEVALGGNTELGVVLYSRETGLPVPNQRIAWSITGEGASLSAFESITDDLGFATNTFRATTTLGSFGVRAEFPDTNPVNFTATVVNLPAGSLLVNVINAGGSQLAMTPYDLAVYYTDDFACRHFNPLAMPANPIVSTQAMRDGDQVVFENLLAGYDYTIAGIAYGPGGAIVGKACVDKETVFADQSRELDLIFQLIPLNPVGTYGVRSYFDFGDAIEATGAVGEWIVMIFDGFDNPGGLLYDIIIDLCGQFAPGLLCNGIDLVAGVTGLRDDIQDKITEMVTSSNTGCCILRAGCDLRSAIRTLEVLSNLYMSKLGADFRIYGTTTFTGLALYWRLNCPAGSPPDCGRFELSAQEMADLQLIAGDWEGTVMSYDKLVITSHPVDLRYGKLISYVIDSVLLPALTGLPAPVSFQDALEHWFNCEGFASWLSGVSILGASLSYDSAYSVCSGAIGLLGGLLDFGDAILSLQELSSAMTLSGEVKLVENNGDFAVDELVDGTWAGTLNFGGSMSPIYGVWTGCRLDGAASCTYPAANVSFLGGSGACSTCSCNR